MEDELFQEKLDKEKKAAEIVITAKLKAKLEKESKDRVAEMEKELSEKSEKLSDFNKMVAENAKLQREKLETSYPKSHDSATLSIVISK